MVSPANNESLNAPPEPDAVDEVVEARLLFTEAEEAAQLIGSLGGGGDEAAAAAERVCTILDRYQEQPGVLDPALELLVVPLLSVVRTLAHAGGAAVSASLRPPCRVMYTLCKVRGYKTVVKFVPHEARDLEPLVGLLGTLAPEDGDTWQISYSLMVWLSMVVMVPFDLSIIDSSAASAASASSSSSAATAAADADADAPVPLVRRIELLAPSRLS